MAKKLIIISGTMGVGKTEVCRKLYEGLEDSVWLDGDWCWMMNPFIVDDETKAMVLDNIAHMLKNFLNCSHYRYVIFSWVMHLQQIFDELLGRLEGCGYELFKFSIMCSKEELKRRIIGREGMIDDIEDIVRDTVSRLKLYHDLDTVKIDTTDISANDAAGIIKDMVK